VLEEIIFPKAHLWATPALLPENEVR